jgi:hypothetical protein
VFAAYASSRGRTLVDRELYLPKSWTSDRERCRAAGVPHDRAFATKTELARNLVTRALASPLPVAWVTADAPWRAGSIGGRRQAVPAGYTGWGGPLRPAATPKAPAAAPAETRASTESRTGRRLLRNQSVSAMAASTMIPMAVCTTAGDTHLSWCATGTITTAAAAAIVTARRQSTCRYALARIVAFRISAAMLLNGTAVTGPNARLSTGALMSAMPMPVTRWAVLPSAIAAATAASIKGPVIGQSEGSRVSFVTKAIASPR